MVISPLTRRRADDLAAALDDRAAPRSAETATLVALVETLDLPGRASEFAPGPQPEFRAALRRRLVAVAAVTAPADAAPPPTRTPPAPARYGPRLRLATAVAAAVTLLAGISVGASTSLPGNPLYGLKRTAERIQLAAAGSDYARGVRELQFARTRLTEAAALAGASSALEPSGGAAPVAPYSGSAATASRISATLSDMDAETRDGAQDLARNYVSDHHPQALTTLHAFVVRQYDELSALLPALPTAAAEHARRSLAGLDYIDTVVYPVLRSAGLCATNSCPTPLTGATASQAPTGGSTARPGRPGPRPTASGGTNGPAPTPGATTPAIVPTPGVPTTPLPAPGGTSSDPLGGLLSGVPLPTGTSNLPLPVPSLLPSTTLLPGVGVTGGSTTSPAPAVTACVSPLVLVGGICTSLSLP